ncbi:MAG: GAF domain-containing protein [Terriglobales bacterium]
MPDPVAAAPNGERRRSVRQKLHSPVYASFKGPQTGMVVDLSELLDLHEEGFAVQTSERLEPNRAVTLCLDLPETKSYIHGSGQVIWSDDSGRGGVRFSALAEGSRRILKEWLFANLLIGCANHAARSEQLARREEEKFPELAQAHESSAVSPSLAAVEAVEEDCREVAATGDDGDSALQLITEHALQLTGASGAAIALLADDRMTCRARAGDPAPPLGAPVDPRQGLTGECVRSGLLVWCEDTENDARVDPEVGRALGIGSLMAAPIVSDFRVVGLLEVFSPHPRAFTEAHGTLLRQLVEMIPQTGREKLRPGNSQLVAPSDTPVAPEGASGVAWPAASESSSTQPAASKQAAPAGPEQVVPEHVPELVAEQLEPAPESPPQAPSRLLYRALIGLTIAVVLMVLGYLAGSIAKNRAELQRVSQGQGIEAVSANSGSGATGSNSDDQRLNDQRLHPKSLPELQKLAEQGDVDAQWQMGVRYHHGEGVPQDDAQAVQWFERAAQQGNVAAQGALGAYYWRGWRGVPHNLSKAYFWSAIAVAQGDEISKSRLEGLSSQMTRAQITAARQEAEAWIHAHTQRADSGAH